MAGHVASGSKQALDDAALCVLSLEQVREQTRVPLLRLRGDGLRFLERLQPVTAQLNDCVAQEPHLIAKRCISLIKGVARIHRQQGFGDREARTKVVPFFALLHFLSESFACSIVRRRVVATKCLTARENLLAARVLARVVQFRLFRLFFSETLIVFDHFIFLLAPIALLLGHQYGRLLCGLLLCFADHFGAPLSRQWPCSFLLGRDGLLLCALCSCYRAQDGYLDYELHCGHCLAVVERNLFNEWLYTEQLSLSRLYCSRVAIIHCRHFLLP